MTHDAAIEGCAAIVGARFVSWAADGTIRKWDQVSGAELARIEENSAIQACDGTVKRLAAATANGTLRLWRLDNLTPLQTLCSTDTASNLIRPRRLPRWRFLDGIECHRGGERDIGNRCRDWRTAAVADVRNTERIGTGRRCARRRRQPVTDVDDRCCVVPRAGLAGPLTSNGPVPSIDGAVLTDDGSRAIVWRANTL